MLAIMTCFPILIIFQAMQNATILFYDTCSQPVQLLYLRRVSWSAQGVVPNKVRSILMSSIEIFVSSWVKSGFICCHYLSLSSTFRSFLFLYSLTFSSPSLFWNWTIRLSSRVRCIIPNLVAFHCTLAFDICRLLFTSIAKSIRTMRAINWGRPFVMQKKPFNNKIDNEVKRRLGFVGWSMSVSYYISAPVDCLSEECIKM